MTVPPAASEVVLAACVDDNYLPWLWVLARSISAKLAPGRQAVLHVFHMGKRVRLLERLSRLRLPQLRVEIHPLGGVLEQLRKPDRLPPVAYVRLLLPDLLPDSSRVIYLDADMLVRSDLGELFDVDLSGLPIGAVPDVPLGNPNFKLFRSRYSGPAHYQRDVLEVPADPDQLTYVNSGLLVLDLDQLRASDFSTAAIQMAERIRDRTIWHDQDVINKLMNGRIAMLDPKWNVLSSALALDLGGGEHFDALLRRQHAEQAIIHFAGGRSPWRRTVRFGAEWWRYARWSPAHLPALRSLARHRVERFGAKARRLASEAFQPSFNDA